MLRRRRKKRQPKVFSSNKFAFAPQTFTKPSILEEKFFCRAKKKKKKKKKTHFFLALQMIDIECDVKYIDFEGRADGRSYRKILSHVAPKKMILVHGSQESVASLASYCEQNLKTCQRVLRAADKQTIDLSSDTSMYRIHLKDDLAQVRTARQNQKKNRKKPASFWLRIYCS